MTNAALLQNLENHKMENNPEGYKKDLEERWMKSISRKVHILGFTRTIEGKDNKDFNNLRKVMEKQLGTKIKKERGSLIAKLFTDEVRVDATNREECVRRELLFSYLNDRTETRKVSDARWGNDETYLMQDCGDMFCKGYFDLFPDTICKLPSPYLSSNIQFYGAIQPLAKKSYSGWEDDDEKGKIQIGDTYSLKYQEKLPFGRNGAFYWKEDLQKKWNGTYWDDRPTKGYLTNLRNTMNSCEEVYAGIPSININDFLSVFPEIEKEIADEVSRKLSLERKQVSVSASYNLSFTFDLECTDEVDMQKKIETILQRGLENAGVPIEMTFGSDGVGLAEPNLEKSLDFQYEKVA